ncbi:MAG: VOC family protein [Deltaproteobacteria bacterium]|nr:VOC family protein [Deltaproteobacteria bacterium]
MIEPSAHETILYVRDLDAARGFYSDLLGLQVIYESDFFLSFRTGPSSYLSCNGRREDYERNGTNGRGAIVEFRVADVDAAWNGLHSLGIPFEFPPEDKPWGLRSCCTRDPEGYMVWFSTPIAGFHG